MDKCTGMRMDVCVDMRIDMCMDMCKGAKIFNGRSGIWHLHYAPLAHYHMPQNTDCDPLGCVGVRQCKKTRQSNLTRLR